MVSYLIMQKMTKIHPTFDGRYEMQIFEIIHFPFSTESRWVCGVIIMGFT